ncbi:MAG: Hpt domain-containing protein [Pseudomonadota bacterium]
MKVEIIKIANQLKKKLGIRPSIDGGEGFIDPEAVVQADRLIEEMCKDCSSSISGFLKELNKIWADMRNMNKSDERQILADRLFTQAHEIKDIAAMCGYDLIADFAESLRDYISETELSVEAQRVIIQAHIDAITVAHKKGLKDDGVPAAEELKALIKVAIEKYS